MKGKLLFVCGFPSGGTDLTKTVLNVHPDIYINGEMPFLKNIAGLGYNSSTKFQNIAEIRVFQDRLERLDVWNNIEDIDHNFEPDIREREYLTLEYVLRSTFSRGPQRIWGNKTPQNTENIGSLADLFPTAHFLIVTRDVRDVCLSWRNKWGKDMIMCSSKWAQRMHKGWICTQNIPAERYLYVKYEHMLSRTEMCCRKICDFLDIPFSTRMLEHHKYTTERIDGKVNYGQRIKKENKNKWKSQLSRKMVQRIEEVAFDTMEIFGYSAAFASSAKPITLIETARGIWNDFWALLLVGNRASQNNGLRQRAANLIFELRKQLM